MKRTELIRHTATVSFSTLVSRLLGFVREMVFIRYLGVGIVSDAFWTAFRIPNSLRKICAEGALSAALIPTIVKVVKTEGQEAASRLMTHIFWLVEIFVLGLSLLIAWQAEFVIRCIAPGFSQEQLTATVPLLKILIFFILFISSSALIAGALQAVHHFFIPSFAQVILNGIAIGAGLICWSYDLPVTALAWALVIGSASVFILHLYAYSQHKFSIKRSDLVSQKYLREVLAKFVPSLASVGMVELTIFIDAQFASYLPVGSISLLAAASSFMRMPFGVVVIPFTHVLLPTFSRIGSYAPQRLGYYLFESIKLICWILFPLMVVMSFFAYDIFATLYRAENFSEVYVVQAQWLLITMVLGQLLFFAINRVALNVLYALHAMRVAGTITLLGTIINTVANYFFMHYWGVYGLAIATSCAAIVQMSCSLIILQIHYKLNLYTQQLLKEMARMLVQSLLGAFIFYALYQFCYTSIASYAGLWTDFLLHRIGLWFWVGPLIALYGLFLLVTRQYFGLRFYFLDSR